jgi:hypothetical protein
LRQLKCREILDAVWPLFEPLPQLLLWLVVLRNRPMSRFVERTGLRHNRAKELLLETLDRLADWFDIRPVRGAA